MEPRFVECPCGNRYDANRIGFCPRCGATAPAPGTPGAAQAAPPPPRRNPLRRRVQVGGILLVTWGTLLGLGCLAFAVLPAGVLTQELDTVLDQLGDAELPGGTLQVQVLENGAPLPNATVTLRTPLGSLLRETQTSPSGWANVSLGQHAVANLTVQVGDRMLERRVLVRENETLEVRLDLAQDPPTQTARLGTGRLIPILRYGATLLGVGALLQLAGGIAATMVRWPILAIAGPIPILALTVLLAVATLSVGLFVILTLQAVGVSLIVSGRPAFKRR